MKIPFTNLPRALLAAALLFGLSGCVSPELAQDGSSTELAQDGRRVTTEAEMVALFSGRTALSTNPGGNELVHNVDGTFFYYQPEFDLMQASLYPGRRPKIEQIVIGTWRVRMGNGVAVLCVGGQSYSIERNQPFTMLNPELCYEVYVFPSGRIGFSSGEGIYILSDTFRYRARFNALRARMGV